jgi:glycosyltransferase involved in cell wall biosynthesis
MRPFRRRPRTPAGGTALVQHLFMNSFKGRIDQHPRLGQAMQSGLAPLGEHEEMFRLVSGMNRDIAQGIAASVANAVEGGEIAGIFDAVSAVAAQQFVLLPYYFALFHQNRERNHLTRITGHGRGRGRQTMRVGVFTDTFDEINGVTRFIRDMAEQADSRGLSLTVHTCSSEPKVEKSYRKNFLPLVDKAMPHYPELRLTLPPIAEVLEWADRQQFDAIHVDTPGPMGVCGWIVASMLRVPLLGTYHTDFPAYVKRYTGDHRLTSATTGYMGWFYTKMATVFSRSRHYQGNLRELGVSPDRFALAQPSFNPETFNPKHRDTAMWAKHGVKEPHRILYCGRVSPEKNLGLLADAFRTLCKTRRDVALIIAGDGPYLVEMTKQLAGLPAYFLGYQNDTQLGPIYASSDLFIFPSRTDTMGQVVIEAQASGLPVLVTNEGGPQEVMDHDVTGLVLPATDAAAWAKAIDALLDDEMRRQRMSRTAPQRMSRFSVEKTFEAFWDQHLQAVTQAAEHAPAALTAERPAAAVEENASRTLEPAMGG